VTTLLIPSTSAVATAICLSDSGSASAAEDCQTVLTTTVALRGADAAKATPASADATALRSAIGDLNSRRARDAAILTAAATSGRQANAALLLRSDYRAIAARVAEIHFTQLASASGTTLITQLHRTADAYGALAKAADVRSQAGYTAALDTALAAEAKIATSLKQLTALGYESSEK
jgi:hypothetical protein